MTPPLDTSVFCLVLQGRLMYISFFLSTCRKQLMDETDEYRTNITSCRTYTCTRPCNNTCRYSLLTIWIPVWSTKSSYGSWVRGVEVIIRTSHLGLRELNSWKHLQLNLRPFLPAPFHAGPALPCPAILLFRSVLRSEKETSHYSFSRSQLYGFSDCLSSLVRWMCRSHWYLPTSELSTFLPSPS